jgi:hypothetical protein
MARRRNSRASWRRFTPGGGWKILAGVFAVGLFFWSTWQTQRLDELHRDRVQLERDLEYARLRYRAVQAQWVREIRPEQVLARAEAELSLVPEGANSRSLVALPPTRQADTGPRWLSRVAQQLDRFGELRNAYAEDAQP